VAGRLFLPEAAVIHWLTTQPNPRSPATGFDAGQRGWRLHAVEAPANGKVADIRETAAFCGLVPAHGWGLDLFIERRCSRCEKLAGLPVSPENAVSARWRAEGRKG